MMGNRTLRLKSPSCGSKALTLSSSDGRGGSTMHALERRLQRLEPKTGQRIFVGKAWEHEDRAELDRVLAEAGATDRDLQIVIRQFGDERMMAPTILHSRECR